MPLTIEIHPEGSIEPSLETEPQLSLAELMEELVAEHEDGEVPLVGAWSPLADAALVDLALAVHRLPGSTRLAVASESVAARLRAALPGGGQRRQLSLPGGRTLVVQEGDLTEVPAAAIVNASNRYLRLGAGVSGAIRRRARPSLQAALVQLAGSEGIDPGEGVSTASHGLPATGAIIHVNAVAGTETVVRRATQRVLELAARQGLPSLALPLLGTGTGGLPVEVGASIMAEEIFAWAPEMAGPPEEIILVAWGDAAWEVTWAAVEGLASGR